MSNAAQLTFLEPAAPSALAWRREGEACAHCDDGRMMMVAPSDPCTCAAAMCICLAEGYAVCDACGVLEQVWPRDMVAAR